LHEARHKAADPGALPYAHLFAALELGFTQRQNRIIMGST
jgi:hypothetical protein